MSMPFPGMNPYLEHPMLWEGVHSRLIIAMANQLQPLLDPRYVASVEERVFIEGPQRCIPDVWIQRTRDESTGPATALADADAAVVVEIEELEIHQKCIEILDLYNNMKLVTVVELLSPTNKAPGPGRESYLKKQHEILSGDCHLVEIDLLREGEHALAVPQWRAAAEQPYDYLVCVSRWPHRKRFTLYPRRLRDRLPRVLIPLAEPDPDVRLDLQAALVQVYDDGRYARRLRYDETCQPLLTDEDQRWATSLLRSGGQPLA
jgi:hypothetical protein